MAQISDDVLLKRLRSIELQIQRGLEHIGQRQDVSEGARLLSNADLELMQLRPPGLQTALPPPTLLQSPS
jgi:hypothetical protein